MRNRHSIRLKDFDYSNPCLYFITICVQNRLHLFGEIHDGNMIMNDAGKMIETYWGLMQERFPNLQLYEYVVMPNHFHAIVCLTSSEDRASLAQIVGAFKSITTNEYIRGVKNGVWTPFEKRFWQRNYYEHIIRDVFDCNRIADYIQNNPMRWNEDCLR